MQFSRDDLGSLFNENGKDSQSGLFQTSTVPSKTSASLKSTGILSRSSQSSATTSTIVASKPVRRYWPGQFPHQNDKDEVDEEEEEEGEVLSRTNLPFPSTTPSHTSILEAVAYSSVLPSSSSSSSLTSVVPPPSITTTTTTTTSNTNTTTYDEHDIPRPTNPPRRREYFVAEVLSTASLPFSSATVTTDNNNTNTSALPNTHTTTDSTSSLVDKPAEETEEEIAARRARIRERLRARKQEEEATTELVSPPPPSLPTVGGNGDLDVSTNANIVLRGTVPSRRPVEAAVIMPLVSSTTALSEKETQPTVNKANVIMENADDDYDEEDEDEDDEEEDEPSTTANTAWNYGRPMFRPVFRGKHERSTLIEAETKAKEEQAAAAAQAKLTAERAEESRRMVAQALKAEEAIATAEREAEDERARPDDTDKVEDEDKDFEEWRLRELRRIKRDLDAEAQIVAEIAETERRRKLTPEERMKEDKILEAQGLKVFHKDKVSTGGRRGAFFSDETPVSVSTSVTEKPYSSVPVERTTFPATMQMGKLGPNGQPRRGGLAKEDTSSNSYYRDAFRTLPQAARERLESSRGGYKDNF